MADDERQLELAAHREDRRRGAQVGAAHLLALASLAVALAGCATPSPTHPPYEEAAGRDAATVRGYWKREGMFVWEGVRILRIDGRTVDPGFAGNHDVPRRVAPGERVFAIEVSFNRGLDAGGPKTATLGLVADIQPTATYQIGFAEDGSFVTAWLEDVNTGWRTERNSARLQAPAPSYAPTYIYTPPARRAK